MLFCSPGPIALGYATKVRDQPYQSSTKTCQARSGGRAVRQAGLLTQSRTNMPLESRPKGREILSARHRSLMEFSVLSGPSARGTGRGTVGNCEKLMVSLTNKDTFLIECVAVPELNHNNNHPLNTSRTLTGSVPLILPGKVLLEA